MHGVFEVRDGFVDHGREGGVLAEGELEGSPVGAEREREEAILGRFVFHQGSQCGDVPAVVCEVSEEATEDPGTVREGHEGADQIGD